MNARVVLIYRTWSQSEMQQQINTYILYGVLRVKQKKNKTKKKIFFSTTDTFYMTDRLKWYKPKEKLGFVILFSWILIIEEEKSI